MLYGIDYLAGATYRRKMLNNHPEGFAAGFFCNTFGNAWKAIRALAKTGKCPLIRVHAIWDNAHKYRPKTHLPIIKKELRRCLKAAKDFPNVKFEFSPFCEHTMDKETLVPLLKECLSIIYKRDVINIELVNSAWTGAFVQIDGVINEVHNSGKKPKRGFYNFSFDGADCLQADMEKTKQEHFERAKTFFFWTPPMNLMKKLGEGGTVENRIDRKWRPNKHHFRAQNIQAENKAETNFPSAWICKPLSEDAGDLKSCKLCLLIKDKYEQLELKDSNCKVISVANRFDPPTDDLYRYYAKKAGYELREDAIKSSNRPLLYLYGDGERLMRNKKPITIDAAFRDGKYR